MAILVGGGWALTRIRLQRPFESNLTLKLSASSVRIDSNKVLVHIELTYTNTGKAYFKVKESIKAKRTFLKVFAVKSEVSDYDGEQKNIDWKDNRFAELLYNGWFPDIPEIVQEPGETEISAVDLLVSSNIKVINAWVKIYEDCEDSEHCKHCKDCEHCDDVYFWSTSIVFSIENLLGKGCKIE